MTIRLLEKVRDELLACRAATSNREFCESWLAKDESYLRVLRHHRSDPSTDAWATCASKLGYYAERLAEHPENADWLERFERLRTLCQQAIDIQARTKWMSAERMS